MLYLANKLPQHKNRPYLCLIKSVWIPLFPAHVAKVIFGCERFSLFPLTERTCDLGKRGTKKLSIFPECLNKERMEWGQKRPSVFFPGSLLHQKEMINTYWVLQTNNTPDPNQTTRTRGDEGWLLHHLMSPVSWPKKLHLNTPQRQQLTANYCDKTGIFTSSH